MPRDQSSGYRPAKKTTAAAQDWEWLWSPYDEATYAAVLNAVKPGDIVLEIGAGDLRLARRLALITNRVIAWEIQEGVLAQGLVESLPENVTAVHTDARFEPIPPGVTTAVLLMRHCTHFRLYADKLRNAGCRRLITNARWRLGVEIINLLAAREPYSAVSQGWYACRCGHTGFVPGPAELLTSDIEIVIHEVDNCPACR